MIISHLFIVCLFVFFFFGLKLFVRLLFCLLQNVISLRLDMVIEVFGSCGELLVTLDNFID